LYIHSLAYRDFGDMSQQIMKNELLKDELLKILDQYVYTILYTSPFLGVGILVAPEVILIMSILFGIFFGIVLTISPRSLFSFLLTFSLVFMAVWVIPLIVGQLHCWIPISPYAIPCRNGFFEIVYLQFSAVFAGVPAVGLFLFIRIGEWLYSD